MGQGDGLRYLESLPASVILLGLDRIEQALAALGHPQRQVPAVHVAGTNGKGSTCAVLDACLGQAFRVGRYTSPHLEHLTERIAVGGVDVDEAVLDARIQAVRAVLPPGLALTYFELGTVVAFHHFALERVELAVLETGLGGRLDATTACQPLVTALTPIALDHQAFLGDTLAAIAAEKAGILKPGVPAVCAAQPPEALEVIRHRAREVGAPLWVEGEDFTATARGDQLDYAGPAWRLPGVPLALRGAHQVQNLALALAALEVLSARGFPLDERQLRAGAAATRWPGRLEIFGAAPQVLLDAAHNEAGVEALVHALPGLAGGRAVHLVFGAAQDKKVEAMFARLLPQVQSVTLTALPTPRTLDPVALLPVARRFTREVAVELEPGAALARAVRLAGPRDLVLVAGSLYLVGALRPVLAGRARVDTQTRPVTLATP